MADDSELEPDRLIPANDNRGPGGGRAEPDQNARHQVDRVALIIARLIGRRIAREQFAGLSAANDNKPEDAQEDGTGKE